MLSEKKAKLLAENFAEMMFQHFDTSVSSVCMVGSLASGDFIKGKSDLDLVAVLKEDRVEAAVRSYAEKWIGDMENRYGLKDQIEVFVKIKKDLYPPYNLEQQNMFEIARMIYQAVPVAGSLAMSGIPMPPIELFEEEYAALKQAFSDQEKNRKLVLKYMRYMNLLSKGMVEFNKEKTMKLYFGNDQTAMEELQKIFMELGTAESETEIENWMLKNFF